MQNVLKVAMLCTLMLVAVGCQTSQEPTEIDVTSIKMQEQAEAIIIREIVQKWVDEGKPLDAWYSGYNFADDDAPNKAGDDDAPNRPRTACDTYGMPSCTTLSNGMDKCKDMCGGVFYVVEYAPGESICVSTYGAYVYSCNGSNY